MHTSRAPGLRCLSVSHSRMVAVAPLRRASIQDSLSETRITRSTCARSRFRRASGALQLPPPPMPASFCALVMTESRGFMRRSTTSKSNGSTRARRFLRSTAAATRAATSTQRTVDVAEPAQPVTEERMDPDTSGHTTTRPQAGHVADRQFHRVLQRVLHHRRHRLARRLEGRHQLVRQHPRRATACGSRSLAAMAMPGCSNTPWRAKVFRFWRTICQDPARATCAHCAGVMPSAVSIWNGTSGGSPVASRLKRSSACVAGGSAARHGACRSARRTRPRARPRRAWDAPS